MNRNVRREACCGKKILLFGGTTEGREIARTLSEAGYDVTVCVATQTGAEYLEGISGLRILTGRRDAGQIRTLLEEGFGFCIDATHPYAQAATSSIRAACSQADIPYRRLLRANLTEEELNRRVSDLMDIFRKRLTEESCCFAFGGLSAHSGSAGASETDSGEEKRDPQRRQGRGWTVHAASLCDSAREACDLLQKRAESGRILLTTGAKEAGSFSPFLKKHQERLFVRVLPSEESIRACLAAGFARENILTGHGPYSVEENVRTFTQLGIRCMVTKDGGIEGGYPEKLAAAVLCGVEVIVIRRPPEAGRSMEEILREAL